MATDLFGDIYEPPFPTAASEAQRIVQRIQEQELMEGQLTGGPVASYDPFAGYGGLGKALLRPTTSFMANAADWFTNVGVEETGHLRDVMRESGEASQPEGLPEKIAYGFAEGFGALPYFMLAGGGARAVGGGVYKGLQLAGLTRVMGMPVQQLSTTAATGVARIKNIDFLGAGGTMAREAATFAGAETLMSPDGQAHAGAGTLAAGAGFGLMARMTKGVTSRVLGGAGFGVTEGTARQYAETGDVNLEDTVAAAVTMGLFNAFGTHRDPFIKERLRPHIRTELQSRGLMAPEGYKPGGREPLVNEKGEPIRDPITDEVVMETRGEYPIDDKTLDSFVGEILKAKETRTLADAVGLSEQRLQELSNRLSGAAKDIQAGGMGAGEGIYGEIGLPQGMERPRFFAPAVLPRDPVQFFPPASAPRGPRVSPAGGWELERTPSNGVNPAIVRNADLSPLDQYWLNKEVEAEQFKMRARENVQREMGARPVGGLQERPPLRLTVEDRPPTTPEATLEATPEVAPEAPLRQAPSEARALLDNIPLTAEQRKTLEMYLAREEKPVQSEAKPVEAEAKPIEDVIPNDRQDIAGLESPIGEGQEPGRAISDAGTGGKEAQAGGALQGKEEVKLTTPINLGAAKKRGEMQFVGELYGQDFRGATIKPTGDNAKHIGQIYKMKDGKYRIFKIDDRGNATHEVIGKYNKNSFDHVSTFSPSASQSVDQYVLSKNVPSAAPRAEAAPIEATVKEPRYIVRHNKSNNTMEIYDTINKKIETTRTSRKEAEAAAKKIEEYANNDPKYRPIKAEPWEMTLAQWKQWADPSVSITPEFHKAEVMAALRSGKNVPERVLRDYPDLQAKYEKEAEPSVPIAATTAIVKGDKLVDTKTAITYTIENVVKPKGGKVAWYEVKDRRGNTIKVEPDNVGKRYRVAGPETPVTPRSTFDPSSPPALDKPAFAVRRNNGEILYDTEAKSHLDAAERLGIPLDDVFDTGEIINGEYVSGGSHAVKARAAAKEMKQKMLDADATAKIVKKARKGRKAKPATDVEQKIVTRAVEQANKDGIVDKPFVAESIVSEKLIKQETGASDQLGAEAYNNVAKAREAVIDRMVKEGASNEDLGRTIAPDAKPVHYEAVGEAHRSFLEGRISELEYMGRVEAARNGEIIATFSRTKEPWEMTREEFLGQDEATEMIKQLRWMENEYDGVEVKIGGSTVGTGTKGLSQKPRDYDIVFKVNDDIYFAPDKHQFWKDADALSQQEGLEIWIQSDFELSKLAPGKGAIVDRLLTPPKKLTVSENAIPLGQINRHKMFVEKAVASGKSVPVEVLRDYPDLMEKHGTKQFATRPAAESINEQMDLFAREMDVPNESKKSKQASVEPIEKQVRRKNGGIC